MKKNERLIYENASGEKIELSWFSPYTVLSFEEALDNELITAKTNLQDGESYISDSLGSREISIAGYYQLAISNALERNLKKIFNPKMTGKLIFSDEEAEKYINVKAVSLPEIGRKSNMATFNIELVAYDPFWRTQEKTEYITLLQGMLSFPLSISKTKGMIFGLRRSILETEVINIGDMESGFKVVFKANGMVKNPQVFDAYTKEMIRLNYTMQKDDIIEVINEPFKKNVFINGEKAFKHLDRLGTTFFSLKVGKNLIGYQADENLVNLDVIIYYSPLFL